jgi:hypothetical protein
MMGVDPLAVGIEVKLGRILREIAAPSAVRYLTEGGVQCPREAQGMGRPGCNQTPAPGAYPDKGPVVHDGRLRKSPPRSAKRPLRPMPTGDEAPEWISGESTRALGVRISDNGEGPGYRLPRAPERACPSPPHPSTGKAWTVGRSSPRRGVSLGPKINGSSRSATGPRLPLSLLDL